MVNPRLILLYLFKRESNESVQWSCLVERIEDLLKMTVIYQNETRIEEIEEYNTSFLSFGQLISRLNPIEYGAGKEY